MKTTAKILSAAFLAACFTANSGMADSARDRLDAYDRIADRYEKDRKNPKDEKCEWHHRIDRSGLVTFRTGENSQIAIGVENDKSEATKELGGDISILFTMNTSKAKSHKQKCVGDHQIRGLLPSLIR